jgi:hypothetical protein
MAKTSSRRAKAVAICESSLDAVELESQLIEAIDNVEDFRRFVEISTREIVINQWRLF